MSEAERAGDRPTLPRRADHRAVRPPPRRSSPSPAARAASASRASRPTSPSPWPRRASRSASSTPTCGGTRCPSCSACRHRPVAMYETMLPVQAHGVRADVAGVPRRRGGTDRLARAHAAQGAHPVRPGRALGRPRRTAARPATRYRRRDPVGPRAAARSLAARGHHTAAGRPDRGQPGRRDGEGRLASRSPASSRT